MDHTLSYSRVGWTATVLIGAWTILWLIWMTTLTGEARAFAERFMQVCYPGYVSLTVGSVILVLVETLVAVWATTVLGVWLYNWLIPRAK